MKLTISIPPAPAAGSVAFWRTGSTQPWVPRIPSTERPVSVWAMKAPTVPMASPNEAGVVPGGRTSRGSMAGGQATGVTP